MSTVPPATKRARQFVNAAIIGGGFFLILLLLAGWGFFLQGPPQLAKAVDLPDSGTGFEDATQLLTDMNLALDAGDREAFLAPADGAARDALGLWWDNMAALGSTGGAVWPETFAAAGEKPNRMLLGAALPFAESSANGSGRARAGQRVVQGVPYSVVITSDGNGSARITAFEPADHPWPWDEGPIYAVQSGHSTVYGLEEERALVDAAAAVVEQSAVEALEIADERSEEEIPLAGFTVAITDDEARFQRWRGGKRDDEGAGFKAGGVAQSTALPTFAGYGMPDDLAHDDYASTMLVALGPGSAVARADATRHEFMHVIQHTMAPVIPGFTDISPAVSEGFARYFGEYVPAGAPDGGPARFGQYRKALDEFGAEVEATEVYSGLGGYELAASKFHYLDASGADAWNAGMSTTFEPLGSADAMELGLTEETWQEWIRDGE
ncbi:hypothetical protein ACWKWP_04360 [Agromyces soli]